MLPHLNSYTMCTQRRKISNGIDVMHKLNPNKGQDVPAIIHHLRLLLSSVLLLMIESFFSCMGRRHATLGEDRQHKATSTDLGLHNEEATKPRGRRTPRPVLIGPKLERTPREEQTRVTIAPARSSDMSSEPYLYTV